MVSNATYLVQTPRTPNPYLFTAVVVSMLAISLFFHVSRNAPLKRRLWPIWLLITGFIFTVGGWWLGGPPVAMLFVLVSIASLYLNRRRMHFCDNCGRSVYRTLFEGPIRYCPSCGAALDQPGPGPRAA